MGTIYLFFNGNCDKALEKYVNVFGLKMPQILRIKDMPPQPDFPMTDELLAKIGNNVCHTFIQVDGLEIMMADSFEPTTFGNNFAITVQPKTEEETRRIFEALSKGGKVTMPLAKTFFSECYGSLIDEFGINWQVALRK